MINGFQHIGMGVWDIEKTYSFYKEYLGFKIKLNDATMAPKEMEPVIGKVETMRAMMALNVKGGGVVEFIEYKSTSIAPLPDNAGYKNYGVVEIGIEVKFIDRVVEDLKSRGVQFLTPICDLDLGDGRQWRYAYLNDPNGMRIQLVEEIRSNGVVIKKPQIQGIMHIGIGVSDMTGSKSFYADILGFDRTVYSFEGHMPEMDLLTDHPLEMNMAILERSAPVTGPVSFLNPGIIKLFEVPNQKGTHIYEGRRWGDIGCMEFCMDVSDLEETIEEVKSKGTDVYLKPVNIDMGSGSKGKVAYIRDPDGTIVEFVEIETVAWMSASRFIKIAMPIMKLYDRLV